MAETTTNNCVLISHDLRELPPTDAEIIRRLQAPIIEDSRRSLKRNRETVRSNYKLAKLLAAHGFKVPDLNRWNILCLTIDVDRHRVAELRDVLGHKDNRPKATGYKELREETEDDRHCWIYLKSDKYPGAKFRYLVYLPPGGKCDIEETVTTNKYRRIVCKNG